MKRKKPFSPADHESAMKRACTELFDNGQSRVTAVGCTSFPEAVACVVGDYLSDSSRKYVEAALVGVQPITLCLSQYVDSPLGTCWSIGFLPTEQQWESWDAKIDKQFRITDVEGCLFFLDQTNSNDCHIAVEVLVVKLSMTSGYSPSALNDLRNTLEELHEHLNNIKHVVFSITEHSSCCFTLANVFDSATGFSLPVDHKRVLFQMIDDLETCWRIKERLTPRGLFAFYFTSGIQRASEKYLAKFVISLSHRLNRALFREEASKMRSNKIMWIYALKSCEDWNDIEPDANSLCRFIQLHTSGLNPMEIRELGDRFGHATSYQNNPFIERIVVKSGQFSRPIQLPRPGAPLTDNMPLSALVELTLTGLNNTLHLTQLNNGYFPHLAHLSIIHGNISGHLDSDRVPCLKTLDIKLRNLSALSIFANYPLVHERVQSLIHSGRPWQLVATKKPGGWSLASYDEPTANPQDEVKDDTVHPHSLRLPLIQELLLVMGKQSHADEWQSQLRGDPSLEAAAKDHIDRLLVWAPQCVQKMTAFGMSHTSILLEFKEPIPGQTRILTSLECLTADVVLSGDALPNLQSLKLNGSKVTMLDAFPLLETLSFEGGHLQSPLELDAPLLQSFSCFCLENDQLLSLNLQSLPHLSFLRMTPRYSEGTFHPKIVNIANDLGLSPIKRVVFGKRMTMSPYFEDYRVNNVLHLVLTVNPFHLPECWCNAVWQCETLEITINAWSPGCMGVVDAPPLVVLPPLPKVKTLTVTGKKDCRGLLDREMLELVDCTVTSPRMLGLKLRCPALKRIRFTEKLSEIEKEKWLNPATYVAIGAQPRDILFAFHYEMHTMTWALPLVGPLGEYDDASVYPE